MTNPIPQRAYLVSNATGTIYPTVIFPRAPNTSDFDFPITQRWIDTSDSNAEWFLLKFTTSAGVVSPDWVQLSSGGQTTETLSGNTGGAVGPDINKNINVIGSIVSGISIAGNPGTNTLTATLANIPNSSLANSSITLVAGTGISITTSPVSLGGSTTISTTASLSAFNQVVIQTFPSSGTYTPTTGMKYCIIEVVGGGAAGGGAVSTGGGEYSHGGGGGGGEYARGVFTAAQISGSQVVTIGAGGTGVSGAAGNDGTTSSVGILITAAGGGGGGSSAATTGEVLSTGGQGGTGGSGGSFRVQGSAGGFGMNTTPVGTWTMGGAGGSSLLAGFTLPTPNDAVGATGKLYGGGGGGSTNIQSGSNRPGGDGAKGFVIITEFLSV